MNLNDGKIRINQILTNPGAKQILAREFPDLIHSPLLALAVNMTLNQVLAMARGKVDADTIERLLGELRAL